MTDRIEPTRKAAASILWAVVFVLFGLPMLGGAAAPQTQRGPITDREYYELMIAGVESRLTARLDEMDKALTLAKTDTARRLGELNHEQARLLADRERYMPLSTFAEYRSELDKWRHTVSSYMASNTGRDSGFSLAWLIGSFLVGTAISVAFYFRRRGADAR